MLLNGFLDRIIVEASSSESESGKGDWRRRLGARIKLITILSARGSGPPTRRAMAGDGRNIVRREEGGRRKEEGGRRKEEGDE
jgi:hypothetical protein